MQHTTHEFPWGRVIKTHKIEGLEPIIEYEEAEPFSDSGEIAFSIQECSVSTNSLDEAIVMALCHKYGDMYAAEYIMRLLKNLNN